MLDPDAREGVLARPRELLHRFEVDWEPEKTDLHDADAILGSARLRDLVDG